MRVNQHQEEAVGVGQQHPQWQQHVVQRVLSSQAHPRSALAEGVVLGAVSRDHRTDIYMDLFSQASRAGV